MYYSRINQYHLDGIMIGRGALIKPWISTEIKENRILVYLVLYNRSLGYLGWRTFGHYQEIL